MNVSIDSNEQSQKWRGYTLSLCLIVSLFFMWGVANNLNDILIKQFKNAFELSDFQAGLVQSAFYFGYFSFAIPAAYLMRRIGYKFTIVFGLVFYALGAFLFWPAGEMQNYTFFLFALYVIACGLTFLETSANPLVVALGPPESAVFRLNLAQSFNPLGAMTGVFIGRQFIFSSEEFSANEIAALSDAARDAYYLQEAQAVQMPYFVIGCIVLVWAALICFVKFPTVENPNDHKQSKNHYKVLLKRPSLMFAVIAQFFYVGAQVGIWSFLIRYAQTADLTMPERVAADYLMAAIFAFLIGRFVSTGLMRFVDPLKLLLVYAGINSTLLVWISIAPTQLGVLALVASSFFMSAMYPTIFATGIKGLGTYTKAGSSMLVMSIIGGAILTSAMGLVSDMYGIEKAFIIPFFAFIVIALFAIISMRQEKFT